MKYDGNKNRPDQSSPPERTNLEVAPELWRSLFELSVAEAQSEVLAGFPFLDSYCSSSAEKMLSVFRSFPKAERLPLSELLVCRTFAPQVESASSKLSHPKGQELLHQGLGRFQHVPKFKLDALAVNPVSRADGCDPDLWEASHVDPYLPCASKRDIWRAVTEALSLGDVDLRTEGPGLYYARFQVGENQVKIYCDFGGIMQLSVFAKVKMLGYRETHTDFELPVLLGYPIIGYDTIISEKLEQAASAVASEFMTLKRLICDALGGL